MSKTLENSLLADIFEQALSQPPSKAGRRLRSERELSTALGIDRMRIQRAMDMLVEKTILVRRHGSGTFLRKVPKISSKNLRLPNEENMPEVTPKILLADPITQPQRKQVSSESRKLQLVLIDDKRWDSDSNHSIFAGIADRVKQTKHGLRIRPIDSRNNNTSSLEKLAEELRASPADGYILRPGHAVALHLAFDGKIPPVVYVGAGAKHTDMRCSPVVRVDLEEAISRAVRLLAEQGHKRIAFIGYSSTTRSQEEDEVYNDTMEKLNLSFRASAFCPPNAKEARQRIREMFSGRVLPTAVYVGDDTIVSHVIDEWKAMGIKPGKDIAVIIMTARGNPQLPELKWSRMEFHPFQVGRMAVDALLQEIQTAGEELCSFAHLAAWKPGATHLITSGDGSVL